MPDKTKYLPHFNIEKEDTTKRVDGAPTTYTIWLVPGSESCPFQTVDHKPGLIFIKDDRLDEELTTVMESTLKCNLTGIICGCGLRILKLPNECNPKNENIVVKYTINYDIEDE